MELDVEGLVQDLLTLIVDAGGAADIDGLRRIVETGVGAAAPAGARDLTPHEVWRIRLMKAVAKATPPEVYRDRAVRAALRACVSAAIEARGIARVAPRLG